jgi:hypothetical protein
VREDPRRKSAMLATLLSCFPGLGQAYVGYYQTGFMFVVTMATAITILNLRGGASIKPFVGVFLAFFWIFNMIDANRRAQFYNRALQGQQDEALPDGLPTMGSGGSVPMGVILIVVGILVFLDLNTQITLDWLENWWPVALVGFGGWLVYKGRRDRPGS